MMRIMLIAFCLLGPGIPAAHAAQAAQLQNRQEPVPLHETNPIDEVRVALVRLPVAALLGAALALRPKRRGTPPRTPAVLQTQIILAIVGAVIMLVVGASLARAFGIVGAANLIRYRAKIDNAKDAGVMLSTLAIGLACGVGLYFLAIFAMLFVLSTVWLLDSFRP